MAKKNTEQAEKQGFLLYHEDLEDLSELDGEEFKALVLGLAQYSETGDEPDLKGALRTLFKMLKKKIDRQSERYAETVAKRKKAAEARWNGAEDGMHMHANASKTDAKGCTCIPVHQKSMQTMQTETETETIYPLLQNNNNNYTHAREDDPFAVDNVDNAEAQLDRMQEELGCSPPDREVLRRLCAQYPPDQVIRAVTYAKKDGANATVLDVARILRVWKRKDEADDAFDCALQGGACT